MAIERSKDLLIRPAKPSDAGQLAAIYAPFVTDTIVSFETTPPEANEMRQRIESSIETYPWLVCACGDETCGFAYASKHRSREAYQWCAECSAYVDASSRRRGVGRSLYRSLFAVLKAQGYCNVYAGIALPNDASESFHGALAFERIGVYQNIGYKFCAWRDVAWWALRLCHTREVPDSPIPFGELCRRDDIDKYLVQPE